MRWPASIALCLLLSPAAGRAQGAVPDGGAADAASPAQTAPPQPESPLPEAHRPKLEVQLDPSSGAKTGDVLTLHVVASALEGDDVTIPQQDFGPLELLDQRARVEPAQQGQQRFVFDLELLALTPGTHELPELELRVVTSQGLVGSVTLEPIQVVVESLLANEPNAEPKPETQPVVVMQDDHTALYILEGLGAAALVALLTLLLSRWWSRRERPEPPPPPPRPPWEVAIEKLGELRRKKRSMVDQGKGVQFVDEVSDVVREYLGGRFDFDGLETTTDEMLSSLRARGAQLAIQQEVGQYLNRCDLVKFAKVVPDEDEVDLIFAKAQDIVQFSLPSPPSSDAESSSPEPEAHT